MAFFLKVSDYIDTIRSILTVFIDRDEPTSHEKQTVYFIFFLTPLIESVRESPIDFLLKCGARQSRDII